MRTKHVSSGSKFEEEEEEEEEERHLPTK